MSRRLVLVAALAAGACGQGDALVAPGPGPAPTTTTSPASSTTTSSTAVPTTHPQRRGPRAARSRRRSPATTTAPASPVPPDPTTTVPPAVAVPERVGPAAPLDCLAAGEGNPAYDRVHRSGRHFGRYGFDQRTWNGAVARAGYPEYSGRNPTEAPPHVQDAAAAQLYAERGTQPWPPSAGRC